MNIEEHHYRKCFHMLGDDTLRKLAKEYVSKESGIPLGPDTEVNIRFETKDYGPIGFKTVARVTLIEHLTKKEQPE